MTCTRAPPPNERSVSHSRQSTTSFLPTGAERPRSRIGSPERTVSTPDLVSVSSRISRVGVLLSRSVGVAVALLVLMGCGGQTDEPLARGEESAGTETRATESGDGDLGFVPGTYREGDRVVLPITFPDGTSAELVYSAELEIAELGVFPYTSGTLDRKSVV